MHRNLATAVYGPSFSGAFSEIQFRSYAWICTNSESLKISFSCEFLGDHVPPDLIRKAIYPQLNDVDFFALKILNRIFLSCWVAVVMPCDFSH